MADATCYHFLAYRTTLFTATPHYCDATDAAFICLTVPAAVHCGLPRYTARGQRANITCDVAHRGHDVIISYRATQRRAIIAHFAAVVIYFFCELIVATPMLRFVACDIITCISAIRHIA